MIKILTAGESHGKAMSGIADGIPRGFTIDTKQLYDVLLSRRSGIGRSSRQTIESDEIEFTAGLINNTTIGSPISFVVYNKDNWLDTKVKPITALRSGHADVGGINLLNSPDCRLVSERLSGRSTLPLVVIGNICKQILNVINITTSYKVINIGGRTDNYNEIINKARSDGDSLGGQVEITINGLKPGIGKISQADDRLDAILASRLMAIPSVKAVEIGLGTHYAQLSGYQAQDKLIVSNNSIKYDTNNIGGIAGGLSTGGDIVVRLTVKPVPTFKRPSQTIDSVTLKNTSAHYERADTCVVETIGLIASQVVCIDILQLVIDYVGNCAKDEFINRWNKP